MRHELVACYFRMPAGYPALILQLPAAPQIGSMIFWEGTDQAVRVTDVQYQVRNPHDLIAVNVICEATTERRQ